MAMADGFQLEIDSETAARLKAAADAAGVPPADYAREILHTALDDDWSESLRRLAEFDRTGVAEDAGSVLAEFRRKVADAVAKRR